MIGLADEVERVGRAVAAGEIAEDVGAHMVMQFADGGLTLAGALDYVRRWSTLRAEFRTLIDEVAAELRRYS